MIRQPNNFNVGNQISFISTTTKDAGSGHLWSYVNVSLLIGRTNWIHLYCTLEHLSFNIMRQNKSYILLVNWAAACWHLFCFLARSSTVRNNNEMFYLTIGVINTSPIKRFGSDQMSSKVNESHKLLVKGAFEFLI